MRKALPLVVALAGSVACAARPVPVDGAPPDPDSAVASGRSATDLTGIYATLIVENQRPIDYRIYLTRQGGERIGMVRGPGRSTFLLRGTQMPHTGDLRVVAVPIAEREVLQVSANVPRGRTARIRIMPNDAYMLVDPLPMVAEPSDSATKPDSTSKP